MFAVRYITNFDLRFYPLPLLTFSSIVRVCDQLSSPFMMATTDV